jgi:hypothetical protein
MELYQMTFATEKALAYLKYTGSIEIMVGGGVSYGK